MLERSNYKTKFFSRYFLYFKELKILQLKELFDITLGLNVKQLNFIKEKEDENHIKFVRRIKRHHIDLDQKQYFIFYFNKKKSFFTFKLMPLPQVSHWEIHDSKDYEQDSLIMKNRLINLFQLTSSNYNPHLDYYKLFNKNFRSKKENWYGLRNKIIEQFTDRWILYKEDSIEFYKQFYPKFYITFKFMYKDMQLYIEKSLDCSFPDFWFWYFSEYLPKKNKLYNYAKSYFKKAF